MNGIHPGLVYDVNKVLQRERIARAENARLVAGVNRTNGSGGIARAIRRAFGTAIVALGRRVEGGHTAPADALEVPTAGLLRLAR